MHVDLLSHHGEQGVVFQGFSLFYDLLFCCYADMFLNAVVSISGLSIQKRQQRNHKRLEEKVCGAD